MCFAYTHTLTSKLNWPWKLNLGVLSSRGVLTVETCKRDGVPPLPVVFFYYQRGGLMDKTLELSAWRSRVQIPGWGKYSLTTTAVDARVNYQLYLFSFTVCVLYMYYLLFCWKETFVPMQIVYFLCSWICSKWIGYMFWANIDWYNWICWLLIYKFVTAGHIAWAKTRGNNWAG